MAFPTELEFFYQGLERGVFSPQYLEGLLKEKPKGYDESKIKEAIKKGITREIEEKERKIKNLEQEIKKYNHQIEFAKQKEAVLGDGMGKYLESFEDR